MTIDIAIIDSGINPWHSHVQGVAGGISFEMAESGDMAAFFARDHDPPVPFVLSTDRPIDIDSPCVFVLRAESQDMIRDFVFHTPSLIVN